MEWSCGVVLVLTSLNTSSSGVGLVSLGWNGMWDFPWDFLNGNRRVRVHIGGPTPQKCHLALETRGLRQCRAIRMDRSRVGLGFNSSSNTGIGFVAVEPIFLTTFVVLALAALILSIRRINRSDRLLRPNGAQDRESDWIGLPGPLTTSISVEVPGSKSEAELVRIAKTALSASGAHNIQATDDIVQGWTTYTVIGWQPQQVGIKLPNSPEGGTIFVCSSRPRFSSSVTDLGRNRQIAKSVARAIKDVWDNSSGV